MVVSLLCRLKPLLGIPTTHRRCSSGWMPRWPQYVIPVGLEVFVQHALKLNELAECGQQILCAQQHNLGQTPLEQSVWVRDPALGGSLDNYGATSRVRWFV